MFQSVLLLFYHEAMSRTCCHHVLPAVFTFQQVQIGHTAVSLHDLSPQCSDIQTDNNFDFICKLTNKNMKHRFLDDINSRELYLFQ